MAAEGVGTDKGPPLTIADWRAAQRAGDGYAHICALIDSEREQNSKTHAWISFASREQVQQQWDQLQSISRDLPLFGVPFAAKDNIDVEGFVTTGGCPAYATEPAAADASVIANLKAAGAILIGKTNLDQFATGLVGTRSPYGAVANSFDPTRVSGGSSSGSAAVVGRGVVPFSLGTDTAGSGRVPAGLNNIVGLKPTRGALSTRGVIPACRTLDCVSIFALTAQEAETVLAAAEGFDVGDAYSRVRPDASSLPRAPSFGTWALPKEPSLAICADPPWFDRDDHYPAYEESLEKAKNLGWKLTPVDFHDLFTLAKLLYDGPWVAERYAAVQAFIESNPKEVMDPTVHSILSKARKFSAADAFASEYLRQELTRKIELAFKDFDGMLVPTSPTFPTIEQVAQDPVGENSLLGTYTNFVNFLDWSALSIPAGFRPDGLPFGVTLIANAWQEPQLLQLAHRWTAGSSSRLGATDNVLKYPVNIGYAPDSVGPDHVRMAVVGAHLTGFPLNKDLVSRNAVFEKLTETSPSYKLYSLRTKYGPKKPGLRRVRETEGGRGIVVEVWRLPTAALASFMSTIPSPLAIGSIELNGGDWVQGFLCEPLGLSDAENITEYGGWRAYMEHLAVKSTPSTLSRSKSIERVLIANRGEIAVRIIHSLRKLGMQAVVIYSDADVGAQHVRHADISLRLKGSTVAETYLDGSQILGLAKSSSIDAIIPGYGFLAENSEFAAAVEAAGMIWVGPTPKQMSDLGLKHRARAIASEAGVQAVPGSDRLLTSLEDASAEAKKIGFPLMLKSTAGGGGIGLKHCADAKALEDAFHGVQSLASANFGDGGVFLERFVQNARHIEVQILGDGTGRVISAGERDCSLQRRHQKVVEESPAFAVPSEVRIRMRDAAVRLASAVEYRNVGTVEFIYDVDTQDFYFLEVNTRLQVEHPVTEAVTGIDLVECMLKIASNHGHSLFDGSNAVAVSGASLEVRLYAESPLQGFRPCAGKIRRLKFPSDLRVDTWVETGTEISTSYDPLLAKLIATGADRQDALARLSKGLEDTEIDGVGTNLDYLRQIMKWELFHSGDYTTRSLDGFQFRSPSFEVLEPGNLTTVQDYPGRIGYWNVGIPPSGPADNLSFRLANRLVGNPEDAAGIECTLQGPTLRFHADAVVAVTGAKASLKLDDESRPLHQAFRVSHRQVLSIGAVESGYRVYVGIRGGVQVDSVMGSRATFELGNIGGHNGRKLQRGDILPFRSEKSPDTSLPVRSSAPSPPIPSSPKALWTIGVIPGPHGVPDFFTTDGLATLFSSEWRVHHNSNRLGARLTGPKPRWARQTGGEAGLHPSNIHDSPYSIGSVSFTGDEAIVLNCDGPSLGGFVVFCVVASAEMWKMGQVRPGDSIRFRAIDVATASMLDSALTKAIADLQPIPLLEDFANHSLHDSSLLTKAEDIGHGDQKILARQAGDCAMLLEFGDSDTFDLRQSFHIRAFCDHFDKNKIPGVTELSPGAHTLHVSYTKGLFPNVVLGLLAEHARSYTVSTRVPSRLLRLPLAFDDAVCSAAIQRYTATIRPEAPWLPSNAAFLEQLNGIDDISKILTDATALVIGLGDVFLGSPLAIPLDPRHRLFGTKYNPSRNFTPHGAVGIGGQYLCIYATDSPGGYQLVGRTSDIWDSKAVPVDVGETEAQANGHNPWMFRLFDRITFYSVTEAELDTRPTDELVQITDGELDLEEYEAWVEAHRDEIAAVAAKRADAISTAPFLSELTLPYHPKKELEQHDSRLTSVSDSSGNRVKAMMPGRCYKCAVKQGDRVSQGDVVAWIESSKMEVEIRAPIGGICVRVYVKEGDLIDADDDLVTIGTASTGHV